MKKDDITRPEPGSLPARISFIEQDGGSAGYYVRFKDIAEDAATGGEPERKYIPILQHETQEEALRVAIAYRDRRAEELGLEAEPHRGPHTKAAREQMSGHHNRLGLRGLGLSLDNRAGTIYPQFTVMWPGGGRENMKRGPVSRIILKAVEQPIP